MTIEAIASALGGPKILKRKIATSPELVEFTRQGIPAAALTELANSLTLDRLAIAKAVGISIRTLSRRLHSQSRLSAEESDRTVRLARVVAKAIETFGEQAKAARWLQSPNLALGEAIPLELLDTDAGVESVLTILGRIDYGLFS